MSRRGFTLVELLVVIAVIATLVGLLVPLAGIARFRAKALDCQQRIDAALQACTRLGIDEGSATVVLQRDAGLGGVTALQFDRATTAASAGTGAWLTHAGSHEFAYPWGKPSDSDGDGRVDDPPLARTLAGLSPVKSGELLQAAGIVPAGAAGLDRYRGDRSPTAAWNDPWGGPLVLAYGLYQPANDAGLRQALAAYRYNRSCYLAIAAVGPLPRTPYPPLLATGDLQALWAQVGEVCRASEWTEASFATPPWPGIRQLDRNGERCFLSAPLEVK